MGCRVGGGGGGGFGALDPFRVWGRLGLRVASGLELKIVSIWLEGLAESFRREVLVFEAFGFVLLPVGSVDTSWISRQCGGGGSGKKHTSEPLSCDAVAHVRSNWHGRKGLEKISILSAAHEGLECSSPTSQRIFHHIDEVASVLPVLVTKSMSPTALRTNLDANPPDNISITA